MAMCYKILVAWYIGKVITVLPSNPVINRLQIFMWFIQSIPDKNSQ